MLLQKTDRQLLPVEIKVLTALKSFIAEKIESKTKVKLYIMALIFGVLSIYLASLIRLPFVTFILGSFAVVCACFVIFGPFENYKTIKKLKENIVIIDNYLERNYLTVTNVEALRIAVAREYQDEGELYIIEYASNNILYIWDIDGTQRKKLPCMSFEIYEDEYFKMTGRLINPLDKKIQPVEIDKNSKWKYLSKFAGPGHLTTEQISFDELIERFKNVA